MGFQAVTHGEVFLSGERFPYFITRHLVWINGQLKNNPLTLSVWESHWNTERRTFYTKQHLLSDLSTASLCPELHSPITMWLTTFIIFPFLLLFLFFFFPLFLQANFSFFHSYLCNEKMRHSFSAELTLGIDLKSWIWHTTPRNFCEGKHPNS